MLWLFWKKRQTKQLTTSWLKTGTEVIFDVYTSCYLKACSTRRHWFLLTVNLFATFTLQGPTILVYRKCEGKLLYWGWGTCFSDDGKRRRREGKINWFFTLFGKCLYTVRKKAGGFSEVRMRKSVFGCILWKIYWWLQAFLLIWSEKTNTLIYKMLCFIYNWVLTQFQPYLNSLQVRPWSLPLTRVTARVRLITFRGPLMRPLSLTHSRVFILSTYTLSISGIVQWVRKQLTWV